MVWNDFGQDCGSLILRDIMNTKWYLTTMKDEIWPITSTWDKLIFTQDGAPPHFAIVVRERLNV